MKKISVLLFLILLIFVGCYVFPTKMPRMENLTISIPFGDTTITVRSAVLENPDKFEVRGDTVYGRTKSVMWRNYDKYNPATKESLRIHINLEELMNEDIVDLDSTVFGSTVDKILNYVTIYGHVPITTRAEFRHFIYNRWGDTIYIDTVAITLLADSLYTMGADSIRPFIFEINEFPVGDYEHDIDIVFDSTLVETELDSVYAYSETALMFHLKGDTVVTIWQDQNLFSPPESTYIELLNSIDVNLDIWNRIPMGEKLYVILDDSVGNIIFIDTFPIDIPEVDANGITTGEAAFTTINVHIDTTIYGLFDYETMKLKAKVEIPVPDSSAANVSGAIQVRPDDYIKINGNIIVNFHIDNDELGEDYKIQ